ncbi:hypothetical protein A2U01_0014322 [Trifolium medium]|uniref:Uncharacterized protein n=1 Tax=Trifolium medium TaxID=97028 RepID=A0A392N1A6_9FABA|nr:hypothetical protein [Trifolium medium]
MLCPRCSSIFDKAAAKAFERSDIKKNFDISEAKKEVAEEERSWRDQDGKKGTRFFDQKKKRSLHKKREYGFDHNLKPHNGFQKKHTYVPPNNVPIGKWFVGDKKFRNRKPITVEGSQSSNPISSEEVTSSRNGKKKWKAYANNAIPPLYRHPNWKKEGLTSTQIRIAQRVKKESYQNFELGGKLVHFTIKQRGDNKVTYHNTIGKSIKTTTHGEKAKSTKTNEEDHVTDNFNTGFPDEIEEISQVAMISVLPAEYTDQSFALLDKPADQMRSHLKPLFIKAEINEDFKVNKVLIDGGAAVNLMPESFLPKIDKTEKDLMDHNIEITDFN